jgi:hypothetical protein
VSVIANGAAVPIESANFDTPEAVSARIAAANAPIAGTLLLVRVVTGQGVQSNEFVATAK